MRIVRSALRHASTLPEAMNIVASVPEALLHHVAHGRRHPASLYAKSLDKIVKAWSDVLDRIEAFTTAFVWTQRDNTLQAAVDAYRGLLFLLYEHLDVSYGCLRALVPPLGDKDPLLDTQFLDRAKVQGWKEFRLRVRPYTQDRIGAVVNSLKHNQSELASFYLHSLPDLRSGYYVRDVLPSGALGPAPRVHADGNSAFSFSRDMLIHFWNLYYISGEVASLIRPLIPKSAAPKVHQHNNESSNTAWESLAERIAGLPLAFFPDETRLPCPLVRWNPSSRELSIEMPSAVRPRKLPNGYQMRTAINIDMSHATNTLPYFGKNAA